MLTRLSTAAISICIVGCASTGPEPSGTADSANVAAVASEQRSTVAADDLENKDESGEEAVASADAGGDPNEVVCRRETATGSNISRKVCRLRSDIEARAAEDQAALNQMRQQRSGGQQQTNPGGG